MAGITKQEILDAFRHLGELASAQGEQIKLVMMGGALMVILFGERQSTSDLGVLIIAPAKSAKLRQLAQKVGMEHGWPADWLNDAAKGYLIGLSDGEVVFFGSRNNCQAAILNAQLLAMKLSAWRDELDIIDAHRLLKELAGTKQEIWQMVYPYLVPGDELKAQYAFDDLREATHGNN